jgi:hypothetical protein
MMSNLRRWMTERTRGAGAGGREQRHHIRFFGDRPESIGARLRAVQLIATDD